MTLPTCSAFSLAVRTSSVSSPSCLLAFVNCLPAFPICLARPSMPPPVPGTFTPSTRFGLRANLLPSTTPLARPTTVPTPARTVLAPLEPAFPFEDDAPPPFERACVCETDPPPPLARGGREPFRLRARVPELLVLPEERLALAPEFL